MKKYRLKVNTATMLKGTIAVVIGDSTARITHFYSNITVLDRRIVEENPDFWEEVVEEDITPNN